MKTIHKYPIPSSAFTLEIPDGGTILCIQIQYEKPHMWVEVETGNALVKRTFTTIDTGQQITSFRERYIGTYQLYHGNYVGHVYEIF